MANPIKAIIRFFFIVPFTFLICDQSYAGMKLASGILNLNPHALPDEVPAGHLLHDITFNQATKLLYNFLTTDTLFYAARNYGYSGLLSKQTLNTIIPVETGDPLTSGLLFYFCLDTKETSDPGDDELFLAYKKVTDFGQNVDVPIPTENEEFYKTNSLIKFQGNAMPAEKDVRASLLEAFTTNGDANLQVTGRYVIDCSNNFKLYQTKDEISAESVACNDYSFGFIPLGELDLLRMPPNIDQQEFTGIRFYFGYDDTENSNRIRVFFVGSLTNKNYIIANDQQEKTQYARIVERSRP